MSLYSFGNHSLRIPKPMVRLVSDNRSLILAYNTVERLLRGDYFHFTKIQDVLADLSAFENHWPVLGIGTTNWFLRNGETIVDGTAEKPRVLWADPNAEPVGSIVDLLLGQPDSEETLRSPYVGEDDSEPQFPFIAIALCNPQSARRFSIAAGKDIHKWIVETLEADNIGLAAVRIEGDVERVQATAAYHLPLGGADLSDGYNKEDVFRFMSVDSGTWCMQGLFALNPTIQEVLSVPGLPLHLHGFEQQQAIGGHINQAIATARTEITVFPIQDINIRIRDLDTAVLPVKELDQ